MGIPVGRESSFEFRPDMLEWPSNFVALYFVFVSVAVLFDALRVPVCNRSAISFFLAGKDFLGSCPLARAEAATISGSSCSLGKTVCVGSLCHLSVFAWMLPPMIVQGALHFIGIGSNKKETFHKKGPISRNTWQQ